MLITISETIIISNNQLYDLNVPHYHESIEIL